MNETEKALRAGDEVWVRATFVEHHNGRGCHEVRLDDKFREEDTNVLLPIRDVRAASAEKGLTVEQATTIAVELIDYVKKLQGDGYTHFHKNTVGRMLLAGVNAALNAQAGAAEPLLRKLAASWIDTGLNGTGLRSDEETMKRKDAIQGIYGYCGKLLLEYLDYRPAEQAGSGAAPAEPPDMGLVGASSIPWSSVEGVSLVAPAEPKEVNMPDTQRPNLQVSGGHQADICSKCGEYIYECRCPAPPTETKERKERMKKFGIAALWLCCSYLNWGLTMGDLTHRFPYMEHETPAAFFALLGPLGTLPVLISAVPHFRWQLKPFPVEKRWEIFHQQNPYLTREYFEMKYN
jgi:hypothetical protein